MTRISIIIPVWNEIEGLPLFYKSVDKALSQLKDVTAELLFIDDGSHDGSFEFLSSLSQKDKRVHVLKFSKNFGSYVALTAGIAHCSGDAAILLSADLQDPPELIPELLEKWKEGSQVVWAVRRSRSKDALWRQIASRLFYDIFRKVALSNYPPQGYDFCLLDRLVIDAIKAVPEKHTSIFALIVWMNFEAAKILYDRGARIKGQSHWNFRKMLKLAIDSLISYSVLPVRISLWAAIFVSLGLFLYMGFIIYCKLSGNIDLPPGWPSTMTVILLTSGIQLVVLAILGEYLWRTLEQSRGRPPYIISKKIGIK
ncbi:glycosyltransferase family 2 protein [Candidatus Nomurabacteria bacterium]|nr:glycosyltransferase family 2 protein [Candidatus Nomurabacteria bacterium]